MVPPMSWIAVLLSVWTVLSAVGCSLMNAPATHVRLPALFADHMVLQRDTPIAVWGWGSPGGTVSVGIAGRRKEAIVEPDGTWRVSLAPLAAGGPYELSVVGADILSIEDVMVGEVWLASGQSNMEWPVERASNAAVEIEAADHPGVRLFKVERAFDVVPRRDAKAKGWMPVTPETVPGFSAVAYYFGRALRHHMSVPIGLIQSVWGGTPAEAWTSAAALAEFPDFRDAVESLEGDSDVTANKREALVSAYERRFAAWLESLTAMDAGYEHGQPRWATADYDATSWPTMRLPGAWEAAGLPDYDGVVWFRQAFELPAAWAGQELTLHLGEIDDIDTSWVNGVKIGATTHHRAKRAYRIPMVILKPGRNVIAVRVLDLGGRGGFWGHAEEIYLTPSHATDERARLSLAGVWAYRPALDLRRSPARRSRPQGPQTHPTVLFNAMIAPLVPYAVRGVIWYQGESNTRRAHQYRSLFPAMIEDWRRHWKLGDFPFLFVQLANFLPRQKDPVEHDTWPELREAQSTALSLPGTAMVVTIDIGEADTVHPRNKQDVGERLALAARRLAYGEDVFASGPMYRDMSIERTAIRLRFDQTGSGLIARGGKLAGFAIAGEDRKFLWAAARIEGDSIVVSNPEVGDPVAVRYAWANNPIISLYNAQGLPASPFRTDDWPVRTAGPK
jgi:sialate O-acetylesterase